MDYALHKTALAERGFTIINDFYSPAEMQQMVRTLQTASGETANLPQSEDLYAIRKLFRQIPDLKQPVFTANLCTLVKQLFGTDYFLVKAIYFDKPALSNWVVAWHQDLFISVKNKATITGFEHWKIKHGQYNVLPPESYLQSIYTVRIHLDHCTKDNGALHVLPGSHKPGITRHIPATGTGTAATVCEVNAGGIMIMQPLLWHASHKSTSGTGRRVLHLEFSNQSLPRPLEWAEKEII